MTALNEWPLSAAWIANLNVQVWAFSYDPAFS